MPIKILRKIISLEEDRRRLSEDLQIMKPSPNDADQTSDYPFCMSCLDLE